MGLGAGGGRQFRGARAVTKDESGGSRGHVMGLEACLGRM